MTSLTNMIKNSFLFGFGRFMGFSSYCRFIMSGAYYYAANHLLKNKTNLLNRKKPWNPLNKLQQPV
ncbi:hypothetical protein N9N97_02760 [Rickettsiaceae bacterium]|nr:hypothetical protein [Rickettsiaceae bacterium]